MSRQHQTDERRRTGDVVPTPEWVARDLICHFGPSGRILEPCRGNGAIYTQLPGTPLWCEIAEGRDFYQWDEQVDWIITNPPYSETRRFMQHSFTLADHTVLLVPMRNIVSGYGTVREAKQYGGMREIRWYGTGSRLGFPMGNAIAAVYWQRGYVGPTRQTFYEDESHE